MKHSISIPSRTVACVASFCLLAGAAAAQTGHVLNGIGPVNQSMAGASTAAPVDAAGALMWNPASISALERSEFEFGFELLVPTARVRSSVTMPGPMSGSTSSDAGASPIPSFSFVYDIPDSPWTVGMGAVGIGGFGVDYPASTSNPIFLAPPNGFGSVYSQFQMLQMSPTISYQVNDRWSVGFAPTIDWAQLAVDPACFSPPDDANGDMNPTYPSAAHADSAWGFGAQLGVLYRGPSGWNLGASYKSTQSFETFKFNSSDEVGNPRSLSLDLDFPAIASFGVGYTGFEDWVLDLDLRYIDYGNTDGFQESGFEPDASVAGFGWDSILVAAFGAQYRLDDHWTLRGGYAWNENPISDAQSTFNLPAPAVVQQHLALGFSYCIDEHWCFDFGYRHGFQNSIEGPIAHPTFGTVPGSSVENSLSTDSVMFGLRVAF